MDRRESSAGDPPFLPPRIISLSLDRSRNSGEYVLTVTYELEGLHPDIRMVNSYYRLTEYELGAFLEAAKNVQGDLP